VPVPRLQLVQFDKAYNVSAGESRAVELVVEPKWRAVITNETFVRSVEPRPLILWVGDGQPDLRVGAATGASTGGSSNAGAMMGRRQQKVVVQQSGQHKPLDACSNSPHQD
jgi:hypothetical protein